MRRWIVPAGMAAVLLVIAAGSARARSSRAPHTAKQGFRICQRRTSTNISRTIASGRTTWQSNHPSRMRVRGTATVEAAHPTRLRVQVAVFHSFAGTRLENLQPLESYRWVTAAAVAVHPGPNAIAFRASLRAVEAKWVGAHTLTGSSKRVARSASAAAIRVVDRSPAAADRLPLEATGTGATPVTVSYTPPDPELLLFGIVSRSHGATWGSFAPNAFPTADDIKADPDAAVAAITAIGHGLVDLWAPNRNAAFRRLSVAGQRTTKLPAQPITC